jgi:tetratricopeptide (TPR) repeat protein
LYSTEFQEAYYRILESPDQWEQAQERYGFDFALVEYSLTDGGKHFPAHLNTNPDWALVYWDDISAVYLKRSGFDPKLISANEYRLIKPNLNDFSYILEQMHGVDKNLVFSHINSDIQLNPTNQEPHLAKALFLLDYGTSKGKLAAIEELEICLSLWPEVSMEYSAMAYAMMTTGQMEQVDAYLDQALALNPADALGMQVQQSLREKGVRPH